MSATVILWADYDAAAPRGSKWAFYTTKAEQRSNRPDLKPLKLVARVARKGKSK